MLQKHPGGEAEFPANKRHVEVQVCCMFWEEECTSRLCMLSDRRTIGTYIRWICQKKTAKRKPMR